MKLMKRAPSAPKSPNLRSSHAVFLSSDIKRSKGDCANAGDVDFGQSHWLKKTSELGIPLLVQHGMKNSEVKVSIFRMFLEMMSGGSKIFENTNCVLHVETRHNKTMLYLLYLDIFGMSVIWPENLASLFLVKLWSKCFGKSQISSMVRSSIIAQ